VQPTATDLNEQVVLQKMAESPARGYAMSTISSITPRQEFLALGHFVSDRH